MDREKKLSERNALAVGALVMLLCNYIVELNLKNGSVGRVHKIVYRTKEGSTKDPKIHPAYVVVDFPKCTIPEEDALFEEGRPTLVPIPVYHQRCENNCCSESTIPLRVAKAVSTYKSQGMNVGKGEDYEKVVIGVPSEGGKQTPGLEQIAFSRAKEYADFAIIDDEPVSREQLLKIGKGAATEARIAFEKRLNQLMEITCAPYVEALEEMGGGDFDRGFAELVKEYRSALGEIAGSVSMDIDEEMDIDDGDADADESMDMNESMNMEDSMDIDELMDTDEPMDTS